MPLILQGLESALFHLGESSTCTSIKTAASLPTDQERCPRWPFFSRVPWSPPKDSSPGPISTTWPSRVSTDHLPDSGMIHWGAGFSCHSPIKPGDNTRVISDDCPLYWLPTQIADAPSVNFSSRWSLSFCLLWWLMPSESVHTRQESIVGPIIDWDAFT